MVHGPKSPSQKIRLTAESFEKCEVLRYRGRAKHLNSMPRRLFCNALRSFRRAALQGCDMGYPSFISSNDSSQHVIPFFLVTNQKVQ
ncbi:hypothetical protein TNCV_4625051 [Trichonephila clavipes]|nr:hypothetical protein TNCV_4625051 [Trichonephila clavipes]